MNDWSKLFAVLAVVAGAGIALRAWRDPDRRRGALLAVSRLASGVLLGVVLLQPQCSRQETVHERPLVGVMIDTSQSMRDGERAKVVKDWLASSTCRHLEQRAEVRYVAFDANVREVMPADVAFDGASTLLGGSLADWTRRHLSEGLAGVVLLSDGLDTSGADELPRVPVPVWACAVEDDPGGSARIAVWELEPPRNALAGSETSVRLVMQGWGVDGADVPVEVWVNGAKESMRMARFREHGEVVELRLPLRPAKPGSYACELRVNHPAADAAARVQPFVLTVRQEGRSILVLENALGFEGKFLRRALTTDRNTRLDSFTRWKDGRWALFGDSTQAAGATLDLTAAGLAARAAVVVADVGPDALDPGQWQAIAGWVDRGGGLVILGGPNLLGSAAAAAVLGRMVPVRVPAPHRDGRFGVRLTDSGLRHPVFGPLFESVKDFPVLQGVNVATGVGPQAQVLLEAMADGQVSPLVVVKAQGAGRVAVVASDTLWRWRVAAPGWTGRSSPYDVFWSQLIDWVAPETAGTSGEGPLQLTSDRPIHRQGEPVEVRAEWAGRGASPVTTVTATVTDPAGAARPMVLRQGTWHDAEGREVHGFRGSLVPEAAGMHEVKARAVWDGGEAEADMRMAVAASVAERRGEPADNAWLRKLAENSGGAFFRSGETKGLLDRVPSADRSTSRVTVTDAWNHPLVLFSLLGLLGLEWWLRRRSGLP